MKWCAKARRQHRGRRRAEARMSVWNAPGAADAVDPQRLAAEVALLADKATISEEIERMESHIDSFHAALDSGGLVAKRLGFLLQEMHREVNTTGAKSTDPGHHQCGYPHEGRTREPARADPESGVDVDPRPSSCWSPDRPGRARAASWGRCSTRMRGSPSPCPAPRAPPARASRTGVSTTSSVPRISWRSARPAPSWNGPRSTPTLRHPPRGLVEMGAAA